MADNIWQQEITGHSKKYYPADNQPEGNDLQPYRQEAFASAWGVAISTLVKDPAVMQGDEIPKSFMQLHTDGTPAFLQPEYQVKLIVKREEFGSCTPEGTGNSDWGYDYLHFYTTVDTSNIAGEVTSTKVYKTKFQANFMVDIDAFRAVMAEIGLIPETSETIAATQQLGEEILIGTHVHKGTATHPNITLYDPSRMPQVFSGPPTALAGILDKAKIDEPLPPGTTFKLLRADYWVVSHESDIALSKKYSYVDIVEIPGMNAIATKATLHSKTINPFDANFPGWLVPADSITPIEEKYATANQADSKANAGLAAANLKAPIFADSISWAPAPDVTSDTTPQVTPFEDWRTRKACLGYANNSFNSGPEYWTTVRTKWSKAAPLNPAAGEVSLEAQIMEATVDGVANLLKYYNKSYTDKTLKDILINAGTLTKNEKRKLIASYLISHKLIAIQPSVDGKTLIWENVKVASNDSKQSIAVGKGPISMGNLKWCSWYQEPRPSVETEDGVGEGGNLLVLVRVPARIFDSLPNASTVDNTTPCDIYVNEEGGVETTATKILVFEAKDFQEQVDLALVPFEFQQTDAENSKNFTALWAPPGSIASRPVNYRAEYEGVVDTFDGLKMLVKANGYGADIFSTGTNTKDYIIELGFTNEYKLTHAVIVSKDSHEKLKNATAESSKSIAVCEGAKVLYIGFECYKELYFDSPTTNSFLFHIPNMLKSEPAVANDSWLEWAAAYTFPVPYFYPVPPATTTPESHYADKAQAKAEKSSYDKFVEQHKSKESAKKVEQKAKAGKSQDKPSGAMTKKQKQESTILRDTADIMMQYKDMRGQDFIGDVFMRQLPPKLEKIDILGISQLYREFLVRADPKTVALEIARCLSIDMSLNEIMESLCRTAFEKLLDDPQGLDKISDIIMKYADSIFLPATQLGLSESEAQTLLASSPAYQKKPPPAKSNMPGEDQETWVPLLAYIDYISAESNAALDTNIDLSIEAKEAKFDLMAKEKALKQAQTYYKVNPTKANLVDLCTKSEARNTSLTQLQELNVDHFSYGSDYAKTAQILGTAPLAGPGSYVGLVKDKILWAIKNGETLICRDLIGTSADLLKTLDDVINAREGLVEAFIPDGIKRLPEEYTFEWPKLPTIDLLAAVKSLLYKTLKDAIGILLSQLVKFIFKELLKRCMGDKEAAEDFGNFDLNDLINSSPLAPSILEDSCGNLTQAEFSDLMRRLMDDLSLVLTNRELCALLRGDARKDFPELLPMLKRIVDTKYPQLSDCFSSPSDISDLFKTLGKLIPLDICEAVAAKPCDATPFSELCPPERFEEDLQAQLDRAKEDRINTLNQLADLLASDANTKMPSPICGIAPVGTTPEEMASRKTPSIPQLKMSDIPVYSHMHRKVMEQAFTNVIMCFNTDIKQFVPAINSLSSIQGAVQNTAMPGDKAMNRVLKAAPNEDAGDDLSGVQGSLEAQQAGAAKALRLALMDPGNFKWMPNVASSKIPAISDLLQAAGVTATNPASHFVLLYPGYGGAPKINYILPRNKLKEGSSGDPYIIYVTDANKLVYIDAGDGNNSLMTGHITLPSGDVYSDFVEDLGEFVNNASAQNTPGESYYDSHQAERFAELAISAWQEDINAPDITNPFWQEELKTFFAGTLFNLAHEKLIREFAARITQRGYSENYGYHLWTADETAGGKSTKPASMLLSAANYIPEGTTANDEIQYDFSEDVNTDHLKYITFDELDNMSYGETGAGYKKSFFHSPTLRKLDKALVPNISAEQVCNPKASAPRSLLGIDKIIEQSMEDYEKMACIPDSSGVPPVKRALINGVIRCFFRTIACEYALRNVFMLAKYPMDEVFKNNVVLKYFANAIIKDFYNQTRWNSKYPQFLRLFLDEVNRMFKDLEATIPKGQPLLHPLTKEPIVVKTEKQKLAYLMAEQIPSMSDTLKEVISTSLGGYTFSQNNIEKDFMNAIPVVQIARIVDGDVDTGGTYITENRFYQPYALDKEAGGTFNNRLTELGRQYFTDPEALENDNDLGYLEMERANHGGFILEKYIYIDPEGVDGEENGKLVNSSIYGDTEKWAPEPAALIPVNAGALFGFDDDNESSVVLGEEYPLVGWGKASLVGKCNDYKVRERMEEFLGKILENGSFPPNMEFSALGFGPIKFGYRLSYVLPSLENTASPAFEQAQKNLDALLTGDPGLSALTPADLDIQGANSATRDSAERAAFLSKAYKLTERQVVLGATANPNNPTMVQIGEKETLKRTYYVLPLIDVEKEADLLPSMTIEQARDNFPAWSMSNTPSWSSGTGPDGPNGLKKLMRLDPRYMKLVGQDPQNAIFNANRVASLLSLYTSTSMNNIPALGTLFDATKEALVMLFFTALRDNADFTAEDPYETACAQGVPPFPATALSGFPFNLMALFYSTPLKMIAGIVALIDPGYKKYKDNGSDFNFTPFGKHPYAFPYTPMGWVLVFLDFSWYDDMEKMFDSDKKSSEACEDNPDNVVGGTAASDLLALPEEVGGSSPSELDIASVLADIEEDPFNATFKYGIDPALPWLTGDGTAANSDGTDFLIEKDGAPWPPEEYGCEEILLLLAFYNATAKDGKEALEEIPYGSGTATAYDQLVTIVSALTTKALQKGCTDLLHDSAHLIYNAPSAEKARDEFKTYLDLGEGYSADDIYQTMLASNDVFGTLQTSNWDTALVESLSNTCKAVYGGHKFWVWNSAAMANDGITQGQVQKAPQSMNFKENGAMVMDFVNHPTESGQNLKLAAKMRAVQLGYNSSTYKDWAKWFFEAEGGTSAPSNSPDLWAPLDTSDPFADAPWLVTNSPAGFTPGPGRYVGSAMFGMPVWTPSWATSLYFASVTMEAYLKSPPGFDAIGIYVDDGTNHNSAMQEFKDWLYMHALTTDIGEDLPKDAKAAYVEFLEKAHGDLAQYINNLVEYAADN